MQLKTKALLASSLCILLHCTGLEGKSNDSATAGADRSLRYDADANHVTGFPRFFDCEKEPVVSAKVPITNLDQQNGVEPFTFQHLCPEVQTCLGIRDDVLWNARVSAVSTSFPVFQNALLPDISPTDGYELVRNAHVVFTNESVMSVAGVGTFKGASAIGSYLAVPHSNVSGMVEMSSKSTTFKITGKNRIIITTTRIEKWVHKGNQSDHTDWDQEFTFFPCSTKVKSLVLKLPDSTLDAFVDAALVPGAKEKVCERIRSNCDGEHQQFSSNDECLAYMDALPHLDPICQHKYGPKTAMGNSFMCKYLHQYMTPYEPELHCYHSGKGLFDMAGVRKCTPLDCLNDNTPDELRPSLLFPSDKDEVRSKTTFEHVGNGTFAETLVQPEVKIPVSSIDSKNQQSCSNEDLESLAGATLLSLPQCLPALSSGQCHANCTQAIQTYLGSLSNNGALCRCSTSPRDTRIVDQSSLLKSINVDARVLIEFCSSTLESFQLPSCVDAADVQTCPALSTYRGRSGCFKLDLPGVIEEVRRDWSEQARFSGRTTKSDFLASSECAVLKIWDSSSKSRELYYNGGSLLPIPEDDASIFTAWHSSLGATEITHQNILKMLRSNQNRSRSSIIQGCFSGGMDAVLPELSQSPPESIDTQTQTVLLPSAAYSDGDLMHRMTKGLLFDLLPGMLAEDYALRDILDRVLLLKNQTAADLRNNLDDRDVETLIIEVVFRALFEDQLPYTDDKLGEDLRTLNARQVFRPEQFHELGGNLWPTSFMASSYQIRRLLQESEVMSVKSMERMLSEAGLSDLVKAGGSRGGFAYIMTTLLYVENLATLFRKLVTRVQLDECEIKHYWEEEGPANFVMEHLRLVATNSIVASTDYDPIPRLYYLSAANRDPTVFEDPKSFNPGRSNFHQMMLFNGLEGDFNKHMDAKGYVSETAMQESPSLKRYCPGRHISMRALTQLAPSFFPPKTSEYTCHGGMRARHGVNFESTLVRVRDEIDLEVLQADGATHGDQLMIFLHDTVDVPVGWAQFIQHMRAKRTDRPRQPDMDFWSLVMPGFGARGTPLRSCEWPRISDYVADLLRHAKKSYKRVYLFGRGDGGYIAQYAAHKVGKKILYGLITDVMPPAVYAAEAMSKPISEFQRAHWLDPVSDITLVGPGNLLEAGLKNSTWWNQAWEWEFRSFFKKSGARQLACQTRSNWEVGARPKFKDFDAAKELDPDMHILTLSHEFSLLHPDHLVRAGLKQTQPRRGRVHRFKQFREKPADMLSQYYEDEPAEAVADEVSRFVDQTLRIRYSIASVAAFPPDFEDSAYQDDASDFTSSYFVYMLTIIVMTTGLIAEITIGPMLIKTKKHSVWVFSQVMGAAIFVASGFAADPITIPLWIVGFFKFGYPEITGALVGPISEPDLFFNSTVLRVSAFCSGIGYLIHHTGGTINYLAVTFHLMKPSSVGFVAIPLAFQHLAVFMKYSAWLCPIHTIVLLGLEVWFQLEAFYLLTYAVNEVRVGTIMILVSHYIWFVHGCVLWLYEMMEWKKNRRDGDSLCEEYEKQSLFLGVFSNGRSRSVKLFENMVGNDGTTDWIRSYLIGDSKHKEREHSATIREVKDRSELEALKVIDSISRQRLENKAEEEELIVVNASTEDHHVEEIDIEV